MGKERIMGMDFILDFTENFTETVAHCQRSITGLFSSHKKSQMPEHLLHLFLLNALLTNEPN